MRRDDLKKYNAPLVAQMYAMVSWNGKTLDEAKAVVDESIAKSGNAVSAFRELDKTTYAYGSVKSAHDGIKAHIDVLQHGDEDKKYDAIIDILTGIHDKWVETNGKKIDRGTVEKSEKMLFQHLPLQLIGIDEVCKDAMFLAPFLDTMNIDIGTMQNSSYGAFSPSKALIEAYDRKVEKFKKAYKISSKADLEAKMPKIIEDYAPLHSENQYKDARLNVLSNKTQLLTNSAASKHDAKMFPNVAQSEL